MRKQRQPQSYNCGIGSNLLSRHSHQLMLRICKNMNDLTCFLSYQWPIQIIYRSQDSSINLLYHTVSNVIGSRMSHLIVLGTCWHPRFLGSCVCKPKVNTTCESMKIHCVMHRRINNNTYQRSIVHANPILYWTQCNNPSWTNVKDY
jgi:hypothetical protein